MLLVNRRFDDQVKARTYHIRTSSKADVQAIVKLAEKRGLTKTAKPEEYAAFYTSGSINLKPMIGPNFHFYLDTDFIAKWKEGDSL
jgi:hypothetical protein